MDPFGGAKIGISKKKKLERQNAVPGPEPAEVFEITILIPDTDFQPGKQLTHEPSKRR